MVTARRVRSAVVLTAAAVASLATAASAVPLPSGIYVHRIGGTGAFGAGTAIGDNDTTTQLPLFIDSFATSSGSRQLTLSLPTADAGTNFGLTNTASGAGNIPFGEGYMQASPDGRYLTVAGYGAAASTKVIALVDTDTGTVTSNTSFNSSIGPRSVITPDGTNFYFEGSGNGTRYITPVPTGSWTATSTQINNANQRTVSIFGGQLFINGAASNGGQGTQPGNGGGGTAPGGPGISVVGTGLPTTGANQVYIMQTNPNPEQFVMLDRSPTVGFVNNINDPANPLDTKLDVTYVGTDAGLEKWVYNGAAWARQYILTGGLGANAKQTTKIVGVTSAGTDASGNEILYATTAGSLSGATKGNALMRVVDTGAAAAFQLVTESPDNTWLRGLAFVPPASIAGDVNGDGVVNLGDINYVTARWLNTGADGDANGDGVVNLGDINYITARWLNTSEPGGVAALSVVPEPGSIGLLSMLAAGLLARRSRRV